MSHQGHVVEAIVVEPLVFALLDALVFHHMDDMHIDYQVVRMVQHAVTSLLHQVLDY
jgi:hypothetical protein